MKSPFLAKAQRRKGDVIYFPKTNGVDASLKIESIGCSLKLNEVYDGVKFPTPQNAFIEDNLPV
jgi:phosphosulfolactate phosphohydrolase-like enzyme